MMNLLRNVSRGKDLFDFQKIEARNSLDERIQRHGRRSSCSWRFSMAKGLSIKCGSSQLTSFRLLVKGMTIRKSTQPLGNVSCQPITSIWLPYKPSKKSWEVNGARCYRNGLDVMKEICDRQEEVAKFVHSGTVQEPIRTLLLDNYDSYTYNLYQLLSVINGVAPVVLRNDDISWDVLRCLLYEERAFHNVVISPGPGSPTCPSDVGICMKLLQECHDIPILGVCLGHQALGFVHGAQILHAPMPVHGRLSEVEHNGHPLFVNIPSGANSGFKVVRYHSLMIDSTSLPQDLLPTAWTVTENGSAVLNDWHPDVNDPNASFVNGQLLRHSRGCESYRNGYPVLSSNGQPRIDDLAHRQCDTKVLMGVSHRSWPHHGVQFHPESVATSYGKQILENFRNITVKFWEEQVWRPTSLVHKADILGPPNSRLFTTCVQDHEQAAELPISLILADQSLRGGANEGNHLNQCGSYFVSDEKQGFNGLSLNPFVKPGCFSPKSENLRLHFQKLPGCAAKAGGSMTLFYKLFAEEAVEDTFWLDSSTLDQGRARFSFMGGRGGALWQRFTYKIGHESMANVQGGVLTVENASGQVEETVLKEGFLDFLNKELESRQCIKEDYASLPFDFCGGFIGYLGYELKVECGAESNRHKSPVPDAGMFLADRLVVVDHDNDDIYVLALFQNGVISSQVVPEKYYFEDVRRSSSSIEKVSRSGVDEKQETISKLANHLETTYLESKPGISEQRESSRIEAEAWVGKVVRKIRFLAQEPQDPKKGKHHVSIMPSVPINEEYIHPLFVAEKSRSEYIADVKKCQEFIRDGESYEVCLTNQLKRRFSQDDCLGLYLTLRETNPAPYSAWLHLGKGGPCICSSSPERFLQLDTKGDLEAKPIKGTVPRGNTPVADEILKQQLQHSEKDQAENLMVVDLLRNDLGRVCEPGSVYVPSLMAVESYSTVHMLVSTVKGKKRTDVTPVDCVRAAFPGGSMTGAPKLRTMEIIDSLESYPRGVYSGTLGYFSFNSSFDLNIVIRTLVIHGGEASLGAGGAVIALSDPAAEYEEMLLKTKAPIKAVLKYENSYKSIKDGDQRRAVVTSSKTVMEPM